MASSKKRLGTVGLIAAGAILLAACGSATSTNGSTRSSAAKGSPYVIGVTDDLTGGLAQYGTGMVKRLHAVFDPINASGGIGGHPVKIVALDDQSQTSQAVANMHQLISDGSLFVFGSTLSNICQALSPIVAQAQVGMSCWAVPSSLVKPVHPYVFDRFPPELTMAKPIADTVPQILHGVKPKVAFIVTNVPGSLQFEQRAEQIAQAKGWDVVMSATTSATQPIVSSQVAAMAAKQPNVVIEELDSTQQQPFVQDLRQDGNNAAVISNVGSYSAFQAIDQSNYYQVYETQLILNRSTSQPGAQSYVHALAGVGLTSLGAINSGLGGNDYLGALTLATAMKQCGANCTRSSLRKDYTNTMLDLPGFVSHWGFTPSNHDPVSNFYIYSWNPSTHLPVKLAGPVPGGSV